MTEVIYMVSDTGAIKSRDGLRRKSHAQFVKVFASQGYRVCSPEEYEAKRAWQRRRERLEAQQEDIGGSHG